MAYIRIKDVPRNKKKYTYAYLVKTSWRKRKHPKQQSLRYLGKIYTFPPEHKLPHCLNHNLTIEEIYKDLLRVELLRHGFQEKKSGLFTKEHCFVDIPRILFYNTEGKEIVLQLHSGFLCSYSFHTLLSTPLTTTKHFAKTLALSGFHLEPETFVELYEKLTNA